MTTEERFIRILPEDDTRDPGWRYRLERAPSGMAILASEKTLPEKTLDPDANLVDPADNFWLKRNEALWLRDALTALLETWPTTE